MLHTTLIPNVALASVENDQPDWQDIVLTDEEFEIILANNPKNEINSISSGLIEKHTIAISKGANTLVIAGRTIGIIEVKQSGFTIVTIQRRQNNGSWCTYKTYNDLLCDGRTYNLSKTITVPSGYQYRVVCTHYAKKNLLSTEKFENTSNIVTL